jgi:hypothetical protein
MDGRIFFPRTSEVTGNASSIGPQRDQPASLGEHVLANRLHLILGPALGPHAAEDEGVVGRQLVEAQGQGVGSSDHDVERGRVQNTADGLGDFASAVDDAALRVRGRAGDDQDLGAPSNTYDRAPDVVRHVAVSARIYGDLVEVGVGGVESLRHGDEVPAGGQLGVDGRQILAIADHVQLRGASAARDHLHLQEEGLVL